MCPNHRLNYSHAQILKKRLKRYLICKNDSVALLLRVETQFTSMNRLWVIILVFCPFLGRGQLNVNALPITENGNVINFFGAGATENTVDYLIRPVASYNQLPNLVTGTLPVTNGAFSTAYQPADPGFYMFKAGADSIAAGYDPFDIPLYGGGASDDDWVNFWLTQKELLNDIAPDVQLDYVGSDEYSSTWKINFEVVNGDRAYGFISVPAGAGPFPAIIEYPAFGEIPNVVVPNPFLAARAGAIVIDINIHPNPTDEAGPYEYVLIGMEAAEDFYFRHVVLASVRCIDYLETRSDYNGKVAALGNSQGGGLAVLAAGIDNRFSKIVTCMPAMHAFAASGVGKPSGFPLYYSIANANGLNVPAVKEAISYYDAATAWRHFDGDAWITIGYKDVICPPGSVLSGFSEHKGHRVILHLLDGVHAQPPQEYANYNLDEGLLSFFRRVWPETQTPPWPWTSDHQGRWLDAGEDVVLDSPGSFTLACSVVNNATTVTDWPVIWRMSEGPGEVLISDSSAYNPLITASLSGNYLFSCHSNDYDSVGNQFYTLHDQVWVYIGGDVNDLTPPTITLTETGGQVVGDFVVNLTLSEPVVGLDINDIVVTNAEVIGFSGTGLDFVITLSPLETGTITIALPSNVCQDLNGNQNLVSNTISITFAPCLSLPDGGLITGNEILCYGNTPNLIVSLNVPAESAQAFVWESSTVSGTGPWTLLGDDLSPNYQAAALTETTWYRRKARSITCSDFSLATPSNVVLKTVITCEPGDCAVSNPGAANAYFEEWISSFKVSSKVISSLNSAYTSHTLDPFDLFTGENYAWEVGVGFANTGYNEHIKAWADWNNDGLFDATESIFAIVAPAPANGTANIYVGGMLQIPATVPTPDIPVRLVLQRDSAALPCGNPIFGEVEDYIFHVTPVSSADLQSAKISLQPNPTNSKTKLVWDSGFDSFDQVIVTTQDGRLVATYLVAHGATSLPISTQGLVDGVYFVHLKSLEQLPVVKRLVVLGN
jgi:cephalosporin-C deacetylase-like acetyl esterase